MARALLVLSRPDIREKARRWIDGVPAGTRVTFQGPKRTLPQNSKLWAMLTDVATQKTHFGQKYTTDKWKILFLHALGREARFIPALDGRGFIPIGQSSSDLDVEEMSDLIEFIYAWGAENGVEWSDPENPADKRADDAERAA